MRWWHPEPDQPELLDWYRPLLEVARKALDDEYPWCVHLQPEPAYADWDGTGWGPPTLRVVR